MKRLLLRIVPLTLAIGSIGGGAYAATGHGVGWGHTNERPGKGCGDTSHVHYRQAEC